LKYSAGVEAARLILKPMDVLFNRTNSIEHVGRTSIWRGQKENVSFASYIVRLVPDTTRILPEYLNFWLNFEVTQALIRNFATVGVHQVNINPTNLRKAQISLPKNVCEQQAIIDALNNQSALFQSDANQLAKLKQVKTGLMQDLLTGKVRVTALLETQPYTAQG
jgi:type I restriction enzyme, S subunit